MDPEIARQFAIRDSFRKKIAMQKSPAQRMHEMAARMQALADAYKMSPAGYSHFLRRNLKKRAIDVTRLNEQ